MVRGTFLRGFCIDGHQAPWARSDEASSREQGLALGVSFCSGSFVTGNFVAKCIFGDIIPILSSWVVSRCSIVLPPLNLRWRAATQHDVAGVAWGLSADGADEHRCGFPICVHLCHLWIVILSGKVMESYGVSFVCIVFLSSACFRQNFSEFRGLVMQMTSASVGSLGTPSGAGMKCFRGARQRGRCGLFREGCVDSAMLKPVLDSDGNLTENGRLHLVRMLDEAIASG